jgi:serine/threonine-protein kinase
VLGYFLLTGSGAVEVPEVLGMTLDEATTELEEAGLAVGSVESTENADVPVGTVVEQSPEAGAEVSEGDTVDLVVAAEEEVEVPTVPDVVGQTESDAIASIEAAGFVARSYYEYSDAVAQGVVAEQLPAAGSAAEPGSTVGIMVSQGQQPAPPPEPEQPDQPAQETVAVPDVTGQTSDAAVSTLNGAGLLAQPFEAYSDTVAEGTVITQYPEAGTEVLQGSSVAVVVSLGEEPSNGPDAVEVPDVVGMSAAEAEQTLTDAGLGVVDIEYPSSDAPQGEVFAQIPEAGAQVSKDSFVAILISSGPPQPEASQ